MHAQTSICTAALALAGCAAAPAAEPDELALPGDTFYPESIAAAADGRLFVGSFGTGAVATFAPAATTATAFVAAGSDVKRTLGVAVDPVGGSLWLCADDTSTSNPSPPFVRRYDLVTAAVQATYAFPAAAFCNDLTFDGHHNLYVTDSLGKLYRLADGASQLAVWSSDPLLVPSTPGGFGANGVAVSGSTVYATNFNDNKLVQLAIQPDGSAGPASEIRVTPPLDGPDALRVLGDGSLLVIEQTGGRVSHVTLPDGQAAPLASGLAMPTSAAVVGGDAWVTEGQLGHILGTLPGPPTLPFTVRRIALP